MIKKTRIQWIDYVRGFAMMLIIIGHTYSKPGFAQNFIFTVNVPIFFVLSGYLTKQRSIKVTIKKNFFTLLVPYIVTALTIFVISFIRYYIHIPLVNVQSTNYHYLIAGLYGIGTDSVHSIIPGIKTMPAIGAIWFLLAMYFGNIMYQSLLSIANKYFKKQKDNTIFLIITSLILSLVGFRLSQIYILPWSLNASLISIIFYISGHLIKQYNLLQKDYLAIIGLACWLLNSHTTPFWFNIGYTENALTTLIGAIGGSYCLMFIFKKLDKYINVKWLSAFGKCSMIALAFHVICLDCFGDVGFLTKHMIDFNFNSLSIDTIISIYRIIGCILITYILTKSTLIKKLFAIR